MPDQAPPRYYSQFGQDKHIAEKYYPNKQTGFFVEVGAHDGVDKSNTLYFEQLGWRGICIEPSPHRFERLKRARECVCVNKAVLPRSGHVEFLDIVGWGEALSGVIDNYDPRHVDRIARETENNELTLERNKVTVACEPLAKIFEDYGVRHVDYMSVDVEGSELSVLESIEFDRAKIDLIEVENNYKETIVREFLESKGYIFSESIKIDELYVRKGSALFDRIGLG